MPEQWFLWESQHTLCLPVQDRQPNQEQIPQANQELLSPSPGTKSSVGQLLPGGEAGVRAGSPLTTLILEQVHDAALSSNIVWISLATLFGYHDDTWFSLFPLL